MGTIPSPPADPNAVSIVANDLISSALRLIGVIAAGEPIDIASANDSLMVLNHMIDSWNADRLTIYTTPSKDFPFVLGTQTYTLGSGGDFDMSRPPKITGMSSILLTNPTNPIEIPIRMLSVDEWQQKVPVKVVDSSFPTECYDDGAFPFRNLNFWPIPTLQQNSVRIYGWGANALVSSLQATITLPPGYAKALRYNLAIDLASEFAQPVTAEVQATAISSLAIIKTMNAPDLSMMSDLVHSPANADYKAVLFGIGF